MDLDTQYASQRNNNNHFSVRIVYGRSFDNAAKKMMTASVERQLFSNDGLEGAPVT